MNRSQPIIMKVFLSGMLALGVNVVQAQSGSLEPPITAVDGSGLPIATTQTQPSWDQSLPGSERFVRVLPTAATPLGEGVLDRETGLVWEQSPRNTLQLSWDNQRSQCLNRSVGGKRGWRLPSVYELSSVLDPTNREGNPDLPVGHPFDNVLAHNFWSSTSVADAPTAAWGVSTAFTGTAVIHAKTSILFAWCVRGQGGLSEY